MEYKIIISVMGVIISLFYLKKARDLMSSLIVFFQIISIVLYAMHYQILGAFILLLLTTILGIMSPFIMKKYKINKKWLWLFFTPILFSLLGEFLHLPGVGPTIIILLLPIAIFVYAIINTFKFKYELSFMSLFIVYVLNKIITYWVWAFTQF